MGVISGVPRMKEISQATRSAKMKGLKVVMPLRTGLLLAHGQWRMADSVATRLVTPEALEAARRGHFGPMAPVGDNNALSRRMHAGNVRDVMHKPRGAHETKQLTTQASLIAHETSMASQRQRSMRATSIERRTADMMSVVDHIFAVDAADDDDDENTIADSSTGMRTLETLFDKWAVLSVDKLHRQLANHWDDGGDNGLWQRAHSVLVASVRIDKRELTSAELLTESVYRAVLFVFGTDARVVVLARRAPRASGRQRRGGGAKSALNAVYATEVAIVALDCAESYEQRMYEQIRLNRHQIFIDLLLSRHQSTDGDERLVRMSAAALAANQHVTPDIYAPDVDETHGATERESELMRRKRAELTAAQTRHLFKNLVSTAFVDIVQSVALQYEPIVANGSGGDDDDDESFVVRVAHDDDGRPLANDSELLVLENYYSPGCFSAFGVGCQRAQCDEHRRQPGYTGCLSNWVLSLRLDPQWFARNNMSTATVLRAAEDFLGPFYHVMIGDANCEGYIPLRVRVYECQIDSAVAQTNSSELARLDTLDAKRADRVALVLDRRKWQLLAHRFSGPRNGSVIMCEEERQQLFTEEKGLEHINETVLVSNSTDLYYLLGLRGIDTRRVRTNSIHDTLAVWGVEAARLATMNEYEKVLGESGSFVHRAHYALRAEVQTRDGRFIPLSAAGLRSAPHDPCQSASHRETAAMFVDAALNQRRTAQLTSPSACVMLGVPTRVNGTGAVSVHLDVEALAKNVVCEPIEPSVVLQTLAPINITAGKDSDADADDDAVYAKYQQIDALAQMYAADMYDDYMPTSPTTTFGGPDSQGFGYDTLTANELAELRDTGVAFSPIREEDDDNDDNENSLVSVVVAKRSASTGSLQTYEEFWQQQVDDDDDDEDKDDDDEGLVPGSPMLTLVEMWETSASDKKTVDDSERATTPMETGPEPFDDDLAGECDRELAARTGHQRVEPDVEEYDPLRPEMRTSTPPPPAYSPVELCYSPTELPGTASGIDEYDPLRPSYAGTQHFDVGKLSRLAQTLDSVKAAASDGEALWDTEMDDIATGRSLNF
jgi:hypothetical protein